MCASRVVFSFVYMSTLLLFNQEKAEARTISFLKKSQRKCHARACACVCLLRCCAAFAPQRQATNKETQTLEKNLESITLKDDELGAELDPIFHKVHQANMYTGGCEVTCCVDTDCVVYHTVSCAVSRHHVLCCV